MIKEDKEINISEVMAKTIRLQQMLAHKSSSQINQKASQKHKRLKFAMRGALVSAFMAMPLNSNFQPTKISPVVNKSENTHYVCGNNVRIRSAPTINSSIITELNTGDLLSVKHTSGNWATINYKGKERFISRTYIKPIADMSCDKKRPPKDSYSLWLKIKT